MHLPLSQTLKTVNTRCRQEKLKAPEAFEESVIALWNELSGRARAFSLKVRRTEPKLPDSAGERRLPVEDQSVDQRAD